MSVTFPDLMQTIDWTDEPRQSEACVYTKSSGDVLLEVRRMSAGWRWTAYGWLGVEYGAGDQVCPSREAAKEAAAAWWEKSTALASNQHKRGSSRALAAGAMDGEICEACANALAGSGKEPQAPESNADASPASRRRTI